MNYLEDKNLSWKAKGLLTFLLNRELKKQSDLYKKDLVKEFSDGYESMTSGLLELKKFGYFKETMMGNINGVIKYYKLEVSPYPKFI